MSNLPATPPSNEIPPARRESTEISSAETDQIIYSSKSSNKKSSSKKLLLGLAILGFTGLCGIGISQRSRLYPPLSSAAASIHRRVLSWKEAIGTSLTGQQASQTEEAAITAQKRTGDSTSTEATLAAQSTVSKTAKDQPDQLLNHRRYEVADIQKLVPIAPDNGILIQPDAQVSLAAMLADARAEGIQLDVISGFRTLEDQNYLYFDLKAERGESARTRAEVSAPPGYSEHHTGYAVDFVDKSQPATLLEESFEGTPAYQWLVANAPYYNFELSFPKNNPGAVAFEPWHWRYVGNQESLELFYK